MSIFEDVFTNAKNTADVACKKAENLYDKSKLKFTAHGLESEINKKLALLGELVYEELKVKEDNPEKMQELLDQIKDLYEQLDSVNKLISTTSSKVICSECNHENPKDSQFCNWCGTKLSD
ncbi:MAG: zinc ribbon domain-containing protein [Bacillota bacterium]|nr:zinc ribbon domain-containing protein [Bacillota bacterium]